MIIGKSAGVNGDWVWKNVVNLVPMRRLISLMVKMRKLSRAVCVDEISRVLSALYEWCETMQNLGKKSE